MRSAVAIAAMFGAGAIGHPSFQHHHPHNKRDTFVTSTIGDEVMVEDIQAITVTVTAGQLPSSQPVIPRPVPEKLAVDAPPAAPLSVTPIEIPTQPSPSPSASSTPVVAPTPAAAPATSSAEGSGTFWATSPMSPLGGGSGAKDILTQANYWRKEWKGLPPFTWSSVLAKNAYMTAINFEEKTGSEWGMNHNLYSGSRAQCEGVGHDRTVDSQGLTPFEVAFLGWLCEASNPSLPCQCEDPSKYTISCNQNLDKDHPTAHADIIGGAVSQIGCYYMDPKSGFDWGVWTCDFGY